MLQIAGLVHRFIEVLQAGIRQKLRQPARTLGPPQFHVFPYVPTDQVELFIGEAVLSHKSGEGGNEFRLLGCGCESGGGRALHASHFTPKGPPSFAFWQFCETLFWSLAKSPGLVHDEIESHRDSSP